MWHFIILMEDEKTMRAKLVTADEQYRLIMECRTSGLTDYQWCLEHNIKPGTFYNWVKRLRKKGCYDIPPAGSYRQNQGYQRRNYDNLPSAEGADSATTAGDDQQRPAYQPRQNQGYRRPYTNQNRQQGGYSNQNRQGGYNNNRQQGGYNNQNRQGGYQNRQQGGYNNQNRQGGYNNRQQGGYNNQNRQGGYNNRQQGGYNN